MKKILLIALALSACSGMTREQQTGKVVRICRDGTNVIREATGKISTYKQTEAGWIGGDVDPSVAVEDVCAKDS